MSEADLVVEVDDEGAGASPAPEKHDPEEISVEDLRQLLAKETRRREAAEQRAAAASRDAESVRGSYASEAEARFAAEMRSLDDNIAAKESEASALEGEYARAYEAGDGTALAKAQRKIAAAEAKLTQMRDAKEHLTANKDALLAQAKQQRPAQQQGPDLSGYTVREREWIDEHPEYLTDRKFQARVMSAHYAASAEGLQRDSDEYFEFLNERVGNGKAAIAGAATSDPRPANRAATPPAVPATRRNTMAGGTPQAGQVVAQLTRDEKEHCDSFYADRINPATGKNYTQQEAYRRYAENKLTMKKEGRL